MLLAIMLRFPLLIYLPKPLSMRAGINYILSWSLRKRVPKGVGDQLAIGAQSGTCSSSPCVSPSDRVACSTFFLLLGLSLTPPGISSSLSWFILLFKLARSDRILSGVREPRRAFLPGDFVSFILFLFFYYFSLCLLPSYIH